jgi:hypothetical protein
MENDLEKVFLKDLMVIDMKVIGLIIKLMAKVNFQEHQESFIMEIGNKIKFMEMEFVYNKMEINMMDNGLRI